jgi:ankyrin repeat protein
MSELDSLIAAATEGNIERVNAILAADGSLSNQKDESGATPVHYAAVHGHRHVVKRLVQLGADINVFDSQFGATPAGWAIEYIRELGGFLAIELDDFAYAIQLRDSRWVERFLKRFPTLRQAHDTQGTPFLKLARESGDAEIARLFGLGNVAS